MFVDFVHNNLGLAIVRTLFYYSQGNAINETLHRAIINMIASMKDDFNLKYNEILQITPNIHNSLTYLLTGNLLYFLLIGFEITLPH